MVQLDIKPQQRKVDGATIYTVLRKQDGATRYKVLRNRKIWCNEK